MGYTKTVLLLCGLMFCIVLNAREITIIKSGQISQNTFNKVKETHKSEGWFADGSSKLLCTGDGSASDDWSFSPLKYSDMQTEKGSAVGFEDLVEFAENSIIAGESSGKHLADLNIDGECWHRTVEWQLDEVNGNTSVEIVCEVKRHED